MLDILYLGRIFPKRASILAKRELKWMPLLGQYMLLSGAVFVNRGNSKQAYESLKEAGETMKRQQTSLWIFPEGTRSSQETSNLLPFKKGAFHLAVQAGLPIIPVVCENYWRLYRTGVLESGVLQLKVLPPISTTGISTEQVGDLAVRIRESMLKALQEISQPNLSAVEPTESASTPSGAVAREAPGAEQAPSPITGPAEKHVARGVEGSETSSVSGDHTEEEEGMVMVGRPNV